MLDEVTILYLITMIFAMVTCWHIGTIEAKIDEIMEILRKEEDDFE